MNKGVAATTGDYIIEIDQDVILHKDFVRDHLRCCKRGRFLTGNRFYIDPETTKETIETKNVTKPFAFKLSKNGVRMLRVSILQKLMASFYHWEKEYQYVFGSNMSFWRDDFLRLNGYDESYEG